MRVLVAGYKKAAEIVQDMDPEINPVIIEHNRLAAKVLYQEKIVVNGLYTLVIDKSEFAAGDQFHRKKDAYIIMGKQIAGMITKQLNEKP